MHIAERLFPGIHTQLPVAHVDLPDVLALVLGDGLQDEKVLVVQVVDHVSQDVPSGSFKMLFHVNVWLQGKARMICKGEVYV